MFLLLDDDDEHSYHFRGKPELLAGISEENLLEQLEIEYLGDITSCNKVTKCISSSLILKYYCQVENYLMCSEYEKHHLEIISEDESFSSSQAHSEQMTAPINNKKSRHLATTNHSFSEPDLLKLFSKYGLGWSYLIGSVTVSLPDVSGPASTRSPPRRRARWTSLDCGRRPSLD